VSADRHARLAALLIMALLAGCADANIPIERADVPLRDPRTQRDRDRFGSVLGTDGLTIFSTRDRGTADGAGNAGIGVNTFLWRATLETIDFMPLASADPFGGLVITDWYQPPETPGERLKLQVLLRDTQLRADGVKVSVFRQVTQNGQWVDARVAAETAGEIEDRILTRARQLRIATAEASR
jgi:hypothetical protein